jgi:glycosyl transferase family 87
VRAKGDRTVIDRANTRPPEPPSAWIESAAKWLSPRRIRAHATVLALCLWGVCAVDFASPGLFDRTGNIKFQDFLPLYVSARLIAQHRAGELYDHQVTAESMQAIVRQPPRVRLPNLYGPQVGLLLVPLSRFSFPVAARIWVTSSLLVFFACVYLVCKSCPALRPQSGTVALCVLAFPSLFHFFARGQMSALVLAFFTLAFLAFRADRQWLAGVALGFLVFKPQFLIAIPLVLLLSGACKAFAGLVVAAAAQLAFTRIYFGPAVMHAYFDTLWHISRVIDAAELSLAPIQMHSLRSFWTLLIAWPEIALALYALSSVVVVGMAAAAWKSSSPLALRFSALTFAAVLVNPHLFVYDLLVLAPALLLVVDWTLNNPQHPCSAALKLLAYLAFILPLFGPISRWTHLQLSVPAFTMLLSVLWHQSGTPSHKFASNESGVV